MIEKVTIKDKKILERILGKESENVDEYIFNLPQDEGIILIGGVNGSGKSTLLNTMHYTTERIRLRVDEEKKMKKFKEMVTLTNDDTEIIFWSNSRDNMRYAKNMDEIFADGDSGENFSLFFNAKRQSEGESLLASFSLCIGERIKKNADSKTPKDMVVIIDEIDSGLSDDIIYLIIQYMKKMHHEYGVNFICSCNSYMMVSEIGKVYLPYAGGKPEIIKNHEEWVDFVLSENVIKMGKSDYLYEKYNKED